jgi:hypothetical protein
LLHGRYARLELLGGNLPLTRDGGPAGRHTRLRPQVDQVADQVQGPGEEPLHQRAEHAVGLRPAVPCAGNTFTGAAVSFTLSPVFNLAASNAATSGGTAATWTSSAALPACSSQADGTYTVQAKATDLAGNTFAGASVSFTLDNTAPRR